MKKDDFKIGDRVVIDNNTYRNLVGEIIDINNFDIKIQCTNGLECDKEEERFKYVVKFEDGSVCDFNSHEMFHCGRIEIFNSEGKDLNTKLNKNKEVSKNNTLTFAQVIQRAEKTSNEEVWRQIDSYSAIRLLENGFSISLEDNFGKINFNDKFERVYEQISFSEAFKQYLKGKTIRPFYNENVEFNINPSINQESIDNAYIEEIDEEWVVLN